MKLKFPWKFSRRDRIEDLERRADSSYTDVLVASLVSQAQSGKPANVFATSALEACVSLVGRSFAAAEVNAPDAIRDALTPSLLEMIGRSLLRRGEIIFAIDVSDGLALYPSSSSDIDGGYRADSWHYRLNMAGPSRITTRRRIQASGVLHFRYSSDPERPWRGNGPLQVAQLAGRLSAETVRALGDEVSGPTGHLLPIPVDGEDKTISELKRDIKTLGGKAALVESGDWGNVGAPQADTWKPRRLGAEPPAPLIQQLTTASSEVYAACGINPAVFTASQGTAAREAWRQVLFGLIAPLGRLVTAELSLKLEAEVSLGWDELRASDIASRSRAFSQLVGAGMDMKEAAKISGVLAQDD